MAAHRRTNLTLSPSSLDASRLRIHDRAAHPRRDEAQANDSSGDEEYHDPQTGRTYTNFFTEDGVRLYRPSAEEARLITPDPRDGPDGILFADDEPWMPPEARIPPPSSMAPSHRRGRSPARRGPIDNSRVPDDSDSDGGSDESRRDHSTPEYGGGASHSYPYPPGTWPPPNPRTNQLPPNAEVNRQHYPAYDDAARRTLGLEHVLNPTGAHQGDGSYYLERTQHYPTGVPSNFPHIMSVDLDQPGVPRPRRRKTKQNARDESAMLASPGSPAGSEVQGEQNSTDEVPDASPYLRDLLGLAPDVPIDLDCLQDPPPGEKPNYPYPTLVQLAIYGSPNKRLTLSEIYATLEGRYEWFRDTPEKSKWQGSIRHNLSLNKVFRQVPRPISCPGKGNWWVVDYSQGEGNKRERKRNRKPTVAERRKAAEAEADDFDESDTPSENERQPSRPYPAGFVGKFRSTPAPAGRAPPGLGADVGPAINPMFIVKSVPPPRPSPGASSRASPAASRGTANRTPPAPSFDDANIDPLLREQGHVVGSGRERRARSTSRQTASPYSPPTNLRRSSRIQNQEPREGSRSPSATPEAAPIPRQAQAVFGQVSFGGRAPSGNPHWAPYNSSGASGSSAVLNPNNALGLGLETPHSVVPGGPTAGSHASGAPQRRSAREAAGPGHSLPSALNGGKRTWTGKGKFRSQAHDSDVD